MNFSALSVCLITFIRRTFLSRTAFVNVGGIRAQVYLLSRNMPNKRSGFFRIDHKNVKTSSNLSKNKTIICSPMFGKNHGDGLYYVNKKDKDNLIIVKVNKSKHTSLSLQTDFV